MHRTRVRGLIFAYALIAVPFAMLIWFGVVPFVKGIIKAFYRYNGGNVDVFNGIDNFVKLASDQMFWDSVANGLKLMAFSMAVTTLVPLLTAWLVHHVPSERFKFFFRIAVMLPVIVPGVIGLLIWQEMLRPEGILNAFLGMIGLGSLQNNWLGDPNTALIGVMLVGLPWLSGINCLLFLGGFGNTPKELYESAQLDGASRFTTFWRVEYPFVAAQTRIIVTLALIGGLQSYENIMILTNGGPVDSTVVPGLLLYRQAFRYGQFGYATSIGLTIMIITMGIFLVFWLLRKVLTRGD